MLLLPFFFLYSFLYLQQLPFKPSTVLALPASHLFSRHQDRRGQVCSWTISYYFPSLCGCPCLFVLHVWEQRDGSSSYASNPEYNFLSLGWPYNVVKTGSVLDSVWNHQELKLITGEGGVFGVGCSHCLFLPEEQPPSIRSLVSFFFSLGLPPFISEDEAFCVSIGYGSLWCPFSPVCRKKR